MQTGGAPCQQIKQRSASIVIRRCTGRKSDRHYVIPANNSMRPTDFRPFKDPHSEHPVAESWRPVLRDIVTAFLQSDYGLADGLPYVAPVSPSTAEQIREYIADYGETLVSLPDEAWETSVARWKGLFWDVIVDLWTAESGRSDMILAVRVFEVGSHYRFEIISVHVP
jgi:hypothetical protein